MSAAGPTAYDVAEHYDDDYFGDLETRYRRRTRFARRRIANVFALAPSVAGRRVIDLGCGMGTFAIEATRAGARGVGIDPSAAALAAARRVAAAENVPVGFVRADAAALPFAGGSGDVMIAADLVEHLDDDTLRRVLTEAERVLGPGGALIVYTPSASHLFERLRSAGVMRQDPSHIGIRDADALGRVIEGAGLHVAEVHYLPSHLPGWNLLERALARWLPPLRRRIGIVARKVEP